VIRVLANGSMLLKAAKQLMPGISGLGPRTGVSQQQISGLSAGLNSQVAFHSYIGKRSFSCGALTTWDSLPASVVNCDTLFVFECRLKHHLFNSAYS